jgi:glyoxylase I family protein
MLSGIAHVGFSVGDLDISIPFYRDLLGFKVSYDVERSGPITEGITGISGVRLRIAMLTLHDLHLELIQYLAPIGGKLDLRVCNIGCSHIAFYVDDIQEAHRFLSANGVHLNSPPNEIKDGPLAGTKSLYLFDPDGITLELMQRPSM